MQIQTITTATIPGYQVYEYLLVLSPHRDLWDKIVDVKKKFAEDYQSDHARWGKPHVTIVNFVQYIMMEERLTNRLNAIAMGYPPFKIATMIFPFTSFNDRSTIKMSPSKMPASCIASPFMRKK